MMERELPEGWVETELGELAIIQSGGTPSRGKTNYWGGTIPWVKISDIKELYVKEADEFITEEGLANSSARIFPKGTILLTIFATIGKVGILDFDATTNQAIAGITPTDDIDKKFLTYSLIQLSNEFLEKGKGVAQKNINLTILKDSIVPLPPLAEQKRIVAKLDEGFQHLDTLKARLERIPELLKNFRQSVLTQAVTGKLTEDWREGKQLPEWEKYTLNEIAHKITDGDHQAPPKSETGVPFIVISNVSNGTLNLQNATRFVPESYYEGIADYRKPRIDDILYTVTGSIGIPVYVNIDDKFCFQRHIGLIRANQELASPKFLYYMLGSNLIYSQAREVATGTAQLTIPLSGIRKFTLDLPSLEEQKEVVKRVEALFAKADAIEGYYATLKEKIDKLPQALLAKAFRGELVPQNPDDEPATVLLEKIKAAKANAVKPAKGKKGKQAELAL